MGLKLTFQACHAVLPPRSDSTPGGTESSPLDGTDSMEIAVSETRRAGCRSTQPGSMGSIRQPSDCSIHQPVCWFSLRTLPLVHTVCPTAIGVTTRRPGIWIVSRFGPTGDCLPRYHVFRPPQDAQGPQSAKGIRGVGFGAGTPTQATLERLACLLVRPDSSCRHTS